MEYRCLIAGDPVAEPRMLLRRLLGQPVSADELRHLRHRTLRDVLLCRATHDPSSASHPTTETTSVAPSATSVLTMPNPSMPSVDITVVFDVAESPEELEFILLPDVAGHGATHIVEEKRRRFHAPHAVLLTFNPFSHDSLDRARFAWSAALRRCRDVAALTSTIPVGSHATTRPEQSTLSLYSPSLSPTYNVRTPVVDWVATHSPSTLLPPAHPTATSPHVDALEWTSSPFTLVLVATRLDLLAPALTATPTVALPTPAELAAIATGLRAELYLEIADTWPTRLTELRTRLAQACVGELRERGTLVGLTEVREVRQSSMQIALSDVLDGERDDALAATTAEEMTVSFAWSPHHSFAEPAPRDDAHAPPTTRNVAAPPVSTSAWTWRRHPRTGRVFFVHRHTRHAQYARPADYDGRAPPATNLVSNGKPRPSPAPLSSSATTVLSIVASTPPTASRHAALGPPLQLSSRPVIAAAWETRVTMLRTMEHVCSAEMDQVLRDMENEVVVCRDSGRVKDVATSPTPRSVAHAAWCAHRASRLCAEELDGQTALRAALWQYALWTDRVDTQSAVARGTGCGPESVQDTAEGVVYALCSGAYTYFMLQHTLARWQTGHESQPEDDLTKTISLRTWGGRVEAAAWLRRHVEECLQGDGQRVAEDLVDGVDQAEWLREPWQRWLVCGLHTVATHRARQLCGHDGSAIADSSLTLPSVSSAEVAPLEAAQWRRVVREQRVNVWCAVRAAVRATRAGVSLNDDVRRFCAEFTRHESRLEEAVNGCGVST